MKVAQKVVIAKTAIKSISQHDDAEMAYVDAALDELVAFIGKERTEAHERRTARWQEELKAAAAEGAA